MSYWKFEKVASTKEVIEKLMEYEREHGVAAVTSIASVCSGTRQNEYYFELKDAQGQNQVKIPISSITMEELNEKQKYRNTVAQDMNNGWHDIIRNPDDMPAIGQRVLVECIQTVGTIKQVLHSMGRRINAVDFMIDGFEYLPEKVVAWQAVTPHTVLHSEFQDCESLENINIPNPMNIQ